nr:protein transport protein sso2 [Quercus suber]
MSQTSTSSSAFQSSNSLSSITSPSGPQQLSLPAHQHSSAPMPSPSAGHHAPHYFGSSSQQAASSQQRLPGAAQVDEQKNGQASHPPTTPFLQDFSLVAEAAKRAQVACLVRDLGDVGLNPYGGAAEQTSSSGYGASSNPYATDAGNPYDQAGTTSLGQSTQTQTRTQYQTSSTSQQHFGYNEQQQQLGTQPVSQAHEHGQQMVQYVSPSGNVLSNGDFLARVEAVKSDIRTLTTHVGQIATLHQRALSSPDSGSSSSLESMITQTQVLNTSIKDQIKSLETDAVRSRENNVKNTQIGQLKSSFTKQLQEYRVEEANYEKRYRDQIARQYRIVNPEATDGEVEEAVQADWGNEGVFQTALKTNRSATASTVLGAVRARHNDIQKIERTLQQLHLLMEDLATQIVLQDVAINQTEEHTEHVKQDTEAANVHLDKGIASARRARKLKWWCFFICVAIVIILALILGLYFGLMQAGNNNNNNNNRKPSSSSRLFALTRSPAIYIKHGRKNIWANLGDPAFACRSALTAYFQRTGSVLLHSDNSSSLQHIRAIARLNALSRKRSWPLFCAACSLFSWLLG